MQDTRNSAPFAELGRLFEDALRRRGLAQKALSGNPSEVSRLVQGAAVPSAEKLDLWARQLGIDGGLVLLWRLVGRYRLRQQAAGLDHVMEVLTAAALAREREVSRRGLAALRFCAVVTGDRRPRDPERVEDLLADDASPVDLAYLPSLPLQDDARLVTDRLVQSADAAWRRERLAGDVVVLGAPSVNLVARVLTRSATFGFDVPQGGRFSELVREGGQFDDRPREMARFQRERGAELGRLMREMSTSGYLDPVAGRQAPNTARGHTDGVIGVARNPWDPRGLAVLAAGRSVAGTLAAVRMLGERPDLFAERPAGFVFDLPLSSRAPDHVVLDAAADAEPTTPPYSIDDPQVRWPDPDVIRTLRERLRG